jgi:hypothetical protein
MIPSIGHQGKSLRLGLYPPGAHKSFDQPQHPSPIHSVEGVDEVVPVEDGQQALDGLSCIARPWLNVFAKDAPRVLDGT